MISWRSSWEGAITPVFARSYRDSLSQRAAHRAADVVRLHLGDVAAELRERLADLALEARLDRLLQVSDWLIEGFPSIGLGHLDSPQARSAQRSIGTVFGPRQHGLCFDPEPKLFVEPLNGVGCLGWSALNPRASHIRDG